MPNPLTLDFFDNAKNPFLPRAPRPSRASRPWWAGCAGRPWEGEGKKNTAVSLVIVWINFSNYVFIRYDSDVEGAGGGAGADGMEASFGDKAVGAYAADSVTAEVTSFAAAAVAVVLEMMLTRRWVLMLLLLFLFLFLLLLLLLLLLLQLKLPVLLLLL